MGGKFTKGASCQGKQKFATYQDAQACIALPRCSGLWIAGTPVSMVRGKKRFARKSLTIYLGISGDRKSSR